MFDACFDTFFAWVVAAGTSVHEAAAVGATRDWLTFLAPIAVGMTMFRPPGEKPPDNDIQRAKWLGWKIGSIVLIGPVYMSMIKEAWILLFPAIGKPLVLGLTGAFVLSVGLCLFVWYAWERALLVYLGLDVPSPIPGMDSERDRKLVTWMAVALIVADAGLMYISMTRLGWRGAVFSFPAILATVCWLSVLMFISYVSARLRMPLLRD